MLEVHHGSFSGSSVEKDTAFAVQVSNDENVLHTLIQVCYR